MLQTYIPVVLAIGLAAVMAAALLLLTTVLGPRRPTSVKLAPFECGSAQVSNPRLKFSVGFYIVAILFIVFDIEVAFVYPWVVRFKELSCAQALGADGLCPVGQSSAAGLVIMMSFLGVLTIGLIYIIKKRVLEWE
jgi:NADH-quinone oxidoreductase subunit A